MTWHAGRFSWLSVERFKNLNCANRRRKLRVCVCVCVFFFLHRAIISDRTENTKILKLCPVPLSLATHGCHSCQAKVQVLIWNEHLFPLYVTNWLRYCSRCLLLYWQRELTSCARNCYVCLFQFIGSEFLFEDSRLDTILPNHHH